MDSEGLKDKPNTRDDEVTKAYRGVFLSSEAGRFVLSDILDELGAFTYRPQRTEAELRESIIKDNFAKLLLWKLGIWRKENAVKIPAAMERGWREEESEKGIIGRLVRLPWNKRTEAEKE